MEYEYRELDTTRREIRVVSLHPAESDDPEIRCDIVHLSLENDPKYCAISYVWGKLEPAETIFLNGFRRRVTPNLFFALRHLRNKIPGTYLWADALCIDQANLAERSSQVNMMGEIYMRAERTLVWLGEERDESDLAMKLLSSLTERAETGEAQLEARLKDIFEDESMDQTWTALQRLFERHYWGRVWILQEVLLSHPTTMCCGNDTCKWDDLYQLLKPSNFKRYYVKSHSARIALLKRTLLPKLLIDIFERRKQGKQTSFLDYLLLSRQRSASDPRDYVYGVLGLAHQKILNADYNQSAETVYHEVVKRLIESEGSLDVLSACCETKPNDTQYSQKSNAIPTSETGQDPQTVSNAAFPSWIPDWRVPFEKDYQAFPLCNYPFQASGVEKPAVQHVQGSDAILIRSILVDSIVLVSTDHRTTRWPQVSEDWKVWFSYNHPANPYGDLEEQREAFYRTLYLGQNNKDNPYRHDGSERFFDIAVGRTGNGVVEQQPGRSYGSAGRQFFGTRKGYMGRGLHSVQIGDLVVVLLGGKVPFVLRESRTKGKFFLVGECYVHGIMNGEVMQDGLREQKDFYLI